MGIESVRNSIYKKFSLGEYSREKFYKDACFVAGKTEQEGLTKDDINKYSISLMSRIQTNQEKLEQANNTPESFGEWLIPGSEASDLKYDLYIDNETINFCGMLKENFDAVAQLGDLSDKEHINSAKLQQLANLDRRDYLESTDFENLYGAKNDASVTGRLSYAGNSVLTQLSNYI